MTSQGARPVAQLHSPKEGGPGRRLLPCNTPVTRRVTSCFLSQVAEGSGGLDSLLQKMEVESGQNISFENFWTLINNQAIQVFGATDKVKNVKCGCLLQ